MLSGSTLTGNWMPSGSMSCRVSPERRKRLPSRWLYDPRGCDLFEQITTLPEYYPTRTETLILQEHAADISQFCGANAHLLEYGAGAGIKTEIVVGQLDRPRSYIPIDIAPGFLRIDGAAPLGTASRT